MGTALSPQMWHPLCTVGLGFGSTGDSAIAVEKQIDLPHREDLIREESNPIKFIFFLPVKRPENHFQHLHSHVYTHPSGRNGSPALD